MDKDKTKDVEEKTEEETEEEITDENEVGKEEEISEENRDADYARDDTIEMLRAIEEKINGIEAKISSIMDTVAMFVDSGLTIREGSEDTFEGDEAEDFTNDVLGLDDFDLTI